MPRLSNDRTDDDKIYLGVMRCPRCDYESTVTNVHRSCPKTPADQGLICPVWCYTHEIAHCEIDPHTGKVVKWLGHQAVVMEYSGFVRKMAGLTRRKRRYIPKNADEEQKLEVGWGVVFDD